jgi:hypothetical protein
MILHTVSRLHSGPSDLSTWVPVASNWGKIPSINFLERLVFSLMLSAVAMPELHSHSRTRALRRQNGPLDTRAGCLHAGFYMLSLGHAAGYDLVNIIVGSTPDCDSYGAPTTASHRYKADNVPPIHLNVDCVLFDRLNSLSRSA